MFKIKSHLDILNQLGYFKKSQAKFIYELILLIWVFLLVKEKLFLSNHY